MKKLKLSVETGQVQYALACALNNEGYSAAGLHAMAKAQNVRMTAIEDDAPQRQGNVGDNIDATEKESSQRAYIGHRLVLDAHDLHPEWSNARLGQYGTAVAREMLAATCGPLNANVAHRATEKMKKGDLVGLVDCPSSGGNDVGHQIGVWHDKSSGERSTWMSGPTTLRMIPNIMS